MPSKKDILDLHFMDARYKLIDLAAFLDRVERHAGEADFRLEGLKKALPILLSDQPGRAKAVLEALSDHSTEAAEAATIQFAYGAPQA
ncbi:hypothetical protein OJ996_16700 [Luteolibacter sp. GHJ8]|uniref:Uncharacterized protein n=1 Tax=Luteolibacter rhizosphaerae TaxID=2989719 RepID=A0ABT3G5Y5_9BACT|nr:hypothetical protein [Luteolibacter rhizosphaerae]MCW1915228.1 hypothetical protein [Luteolibacter rhizosphaerae]